MGRFEITDVKAREIIDCRGWPTVQADLWVDGELAGRADVAQGRSTGTHEAHVLFDGESDRYSGQGVLKAVANVNGEIETTLLDGEREETPDLLGVLAEIESFPGLDLGDDRVIRPFVHGTCSLRWSTCNEDAGTAAVVKAG